MLVRLQSSSALAGMMPSPPFPSSLEEARLLVRKCAEPCPAGDSVKAAIRRSSQRLQLSFTRIRDIWYGDARRIDALEMDRLRQTAEEVELSQAVAAIEFLLKKNENSRSPQSAEVIAGLTMALGALMRPDCSEATGFPSQ
jgi:hypothetical protein